MADLKTFPAWGPYGKKYMGISKILEHDFAKGVRFDLTTVPAIFGGDIKVPNVTLPSGCHPWHCSPDYSIFTYRHDLEWKDRVYAEVSYVRITEDSTLIRTHFVNNSELTQNCLVNYFCSVEYPSPRYCELSLPEKCEFKKATDYDIYEYAERRPWDEQNADGMKKGEFADMRFTGGFGLGDRAGKWHMPHRYLPPFGKTKGDRVEFTVDCKHDYKDAVLAIRYRTSDIKYVQGEMVGVNLTNGESAAEFILNGTETVLFPPTDIPALVFIKIGELHSGKLKLTLEGTGKGAAEFDFLCITESDTADEINTEIIEYDFAPVTEKTTCDSGCKSVCTYKNVSGGFVLRTFNNNTRYRDIETGALEDCMTARLSNSDETFDDVTESFTGAFSRKHSDNGFFHNTIVHTLFIAPGGSHTEYAVISHGDTEYLTVDEYEKLYRERLCELAPVKLNKAGKKYELSCEILKSTALTNAVYPIYKHGENIIHHTPGKRWDCLYTWDSGFIGLGMLDYSRAFAEYSLDTYLSDESNPDYAFLHHGSPVPVQMYLYLEMIKRTNDKTRLLGLYPRLKLYYDFLAGKIRGSTTAKLKSGLTTTYDYFYSSSGMDDYPAQVAMMKRNIRDTSAPVISSSHVIRCAKILKMTAVKLGKTDDAAEYDCDIARLTDALSKYSWDKDSGYFGYVLHDKNYMPTGIMVTENGENLNKGLDGIYPIIAGACNKEQQNAILAHLKNTEEMLSPFGISAVDMTAGYFTVNGYWNGNVWFPHQWFIWKSMLDIAENDFAYTIAELALNIWKREVDYSYYTFEMVNVVTGRGGWFHNFGGLSTPITMWANAYFNPGTLNTGFDTWIDNVSFADGNTELCVNFTHFGDKERFTVLATMDDCPDIEYAAFVDGKPVSFNERFKGTLELNLNISDNGIHTLTVCKKTQKI